MQGQDQTLQRVIPTLIADYDMTVAMRGTGRKMELIIDEDWAVLNTAAGTQTIEMLARIGRSLGVAVTVSSGTAGWSIRRSGSSRHLPPGQQRIAICG